MNIKAVCLLLPGAFAVVLEELDGSAFGIVASFGRTSCQEQKDKDCQIFVDTHSVITQPDFIEASA